ncbi:hypothetical protein Goari_018513 [Gossypium aridum]|uniref:Uncharacterized protein n=1 Tax=Gossypium aridum TaxID=34290 RepID=A0A7J8WPU6_GOSAI|nr:hypothetical protein [Gossypium aridum]
MSNIESSPEGFNMLRRMYENVQEPFMNATTMAGNDGNSPSSNPFAALLSNLGDSQARGLPNNTSTNDSETTHGQTSPNTNPLPNPWGNTVGGGKGAPRPMLLQGQILLEMLGHQVLVVWEALDFRMYHP